MKCLFCDEEIKDYSLYDLLIEQDLLCKECRNKMGFHYQKFYVEGVKIETFYDYNCLFKDILLQYKECYDEALSDVFLYMIDNHIKLTSLGYKILYVPSTKEKLEERGFNHLKSIFGKLNLKEVDGLSFIEEKSQMNKGLKERLQMIDNFKYSGEKIDKLLIVDDVYTTGSSIKGVLKALKGHVNSVKIVILAKKLTQERKTNIQ